MASNPLLSRGIESGWLSKFFTDPFNPLCVMLAMRTKLLLDVVDEMGKSYNLLRAIGFGWIDWGEIPNDPSGDPDDYIPGPLHVPIDGQVPPVPPGKPSPGNPYGGGTGRDNPTGSLAPAWGFDGTVDLGGASGGSSNRHYVDCCKNVDSPLENISIGYSTLDMQCGDIQSFTIVGYNPACEASNYTWSIDPVQGTLDITNPLAPIYTAPEAGADCVPVQTLNLYCLDEIIDSIDINISTCPLVASISYSTNQMTIKETQSLAIVFEITGCSTPAFTWAITAGGGTLEHATGDHNVYTAPDTNVNCLQNPTISLSCDGVELDTLKIAVNASFAGYHAITDCCQCNWAWCITNGIRHCEYYYNCNGTLHTGINSVYCQGGAYPCHTPTNAEGIYNNQTCTALGWVDGINDTRNAGMKLAGCCPPQFII